MHKAPERLEHLFNYFGIEPQDTPERQYDLCPMVEAENPIEIGFLYFIQCNDYTKIGITKHKPEQRLNELQLANPYELSIYAAIECETPRDYERLLHHYYAEYHARREWFKLPASELEKIKKALHPRDLLQAT